MPDANAPAYSRAAGYVRVSTERQAHGDRWSLPTQREHYLAMCARQKWEPCGEFIDVESGRRDTRPEYQRMLALVRSGEIQVVVVQWLDRFGRNYREILPRIWEIEALGGLVVATDEDIQHELIVMIRAWQASEESKRTGQRVKAVMSNVLAAGRWPGCVPHGYQLIVDKRNPLCGQWTVDPTAAPIVRRIYQIYVDEEIGLGQIAGRLNADRISSPRNHLWWAAAVRFILANSAYVGEPIWQGKPFGPGCEPIVDRDVWARAQELLRRRGSFTRRKPRAKSFLLDGLVRCACGTVRHSWIVFRDGYRDKHGHVRRQTRWYRCSRQSQQQTCHVGLVRAEVVEGWLIERLGAWEATPEMLARVQSHEDGGEAAQAAEITHQRSALAAKVKQIELRQSRSFASYMDGEIDKEFWARVQAEYVETIDQAKADLTRLRDPVRTLDWRLALDHLGDLRAKLRALADGESAMTIDDGRLLIESVVECVQVVDKQTFRLVPHPDFAHLLT